MRPTLNGITLDKADSSLLTFSLNPLVIDTVVLPIMGLVIFCVVLRISQVDDEAEAGDGFHYITGCVSM